MHHPRAVHRDERVAQTLGQVQQLLGIERAALPHVLLEVVARHQLGDQERLRGVGLGVQDGGHAGVLELLQGAHLAAQPVARRRVGPDVRVQQLERHGVATAVHRPVHSPHRRRSQGGDDGVPADLRPWFQADPLHPGTVSAAAGGRPATRGATCTDRVDTTRGDDPLPSDAPAHGYDFVVVANRLPVDVSLDDDGATTWTRSPGGLVTALAPVMASTSGAWVGWGGSPDLELSRSTSTAPS